MLYRRIGGPRFPATHTAFLIILTVSWLDGVNLLSKTVMVIVLIYFILKYVARKIVIKASTFNILCTHKVLDPIFAYVNTFRIKRNKNSSIVLLNKVDVIKGLLTYILV